MASNKLSLAASSGTLDVHTVKAGVNYRFGWGGVPVTARYRALFRHG